MKRRDIIGIDKFLEGLKLGVFDKETRTAILKNHLVFYKIVQDYNTDSEEIHKSYVAGREDKVKALLALREEYPGAGEGRKKEIYTTITTEYQDILEVEMEMDKIITDMLNEEVEVEVYPVDMASFVDGCMESGRDMTPSDLVPFEVIFKH